MEKEFEFPAEEFISAVMTGADMTTLMRVGQGLIDSTNYTAAKWRAYKRDHVQGREEGLRESVLMLANEVDEGYFCLDGIYPVALEAMPEYDGDFSQFALEFLHKKPLDEMNRRNLGNFATGLLEGKAVIEDVNSLASLRNRRFGGGFPIELSTADSLCYIPELLTSWLSHNVNQGAELVTRYHDNGVRTWGQVGEKRMCPASSILVKDVIGRILVTNLALKLLAEKYRPDMLLTETNW